MDTMARWNLTVRRNDDTWAVPLRVSGLDLTGVALRAQIRLGGDTPGAPLVDLGPTADPNATGVRLASVALLNGISVSTLSIQLAKADRQGLPYTGELGDTTVLAWGFQIAGITRVEGEVLVPAQVIGSDNAPAKRPPSYGAQLTAGGSASGATLTIAQDGGAMLAIDGADLVGSLAVQTKADRVAAEAARDQAQATAQSLGGRLNAISLTDSPSRVFEWNDGVGRPLGSFDTSGTFRTSAVNTETISGRPASSLTSFFGVSGLIRNDITRLVNVVNGQSLSVANTKQTADNPIITTSQYFSNLMLKGGVRFWDPVVDVSAIVPHIEAFSADGIRGETISGGYQSMMAQLFNAFGVPPLDNPMKIVSMAPGLGETAIEQFRAGTGLFARAQAGVQAVHDLSAGQKVVLPSVKWLQGETQGPTDYVASLIALAAEYDAAFRPITGQAEPVRMLTYQFSAGDAGVKFPAAAAQSSLIQIAGPIYWTQANGLTPQGQYDGTHRTNHGYFEIGCMMAVAEFSQVYLGRPWKPLQISRDARGRVRCRVDGNDLIVRYDVPFDGQLYMDRTNPNISAALGGATGSLLQNGFYILDANGTYKPLLDVVVEGRNEVRFVGARPQAGDQLNVGAKQMTRDYAAATCLRDRMGDVLTIDDLGHEPLHNWAIIEPWKITNAELGA